MTKSTSDIPIDKMMRLMDKHRTKRKTMDTNKLLRESPSNVGKQERIQEIYRIEREHKALTQKLSDIKQYFEDAVMLERLFCSCENRPPSITNGMNACLSCRFMKVCRALFIEEPTK